MGVVLKALDPSLNRFVAIKVLAPELATSASARRRFAREGQAAAAIATTTSSRSTPSTPRAGCPTSSCSTSPASRSRSGSTGPARSPVEEIVRIGMQAARGLGRATRGADPPRHQALEHPAGERRRAGQAHRLRPGPRRRRREPDAVGRRRRHAAVHVARAGRRRAGRPPRRPVQPRQRPLRHLHGPPAVPRRVDDGRAPPRLRRHAPADPRAQPGRPRLARGDRRPAARQGPGRSVPDGGRGRRPARPLPGLSPRAEARRASLSGRAPEASSQAPGRHRRRRPARAWSRSARRAPTSSRPSSAFVRPTGRWSSR